MIGGPLTTAGAIALIEAAGGPEELFGADAGRRYRELARLTHPDTHPGNRRAADAFAKLAALRPCGRRAALYRGDIANLYRVPGGLLKLVRDPADNDLLRQEALALGRLQAQVPPPFQAYFPRLLEARRQADPGSGAQRRANLIGELTGFVSLRQVRAAYPGGVDPRDAAWMWRRLLVALGAAHRAGLIHGAVLPEHVLIHPGDHGLVLVDWCYSGTAPAARLPAAVARYAAWYPPEVMAGAMAGPDLDIWLAARCLTELTAGQLPPAMSAFARGCMLASPRHRPQAAWPLLAEFDELLRRRYGPRKFRPLAGPA